MGFKLAEGKGLREGWDSKELWKSVEKSDIPLFAPPAKSYSVLTTRLVKRTRTTSKSWFNPMSTLIRLDPCSVNAICSLLHLPSSRYKMLTVLIAYMDESGIHGASSVCAIAGLVGTESEWETLERRWRRTVDEEGVSVFHMAEFESRLGEFEGWSDTRRHLFLSKLVEAIKARDIHCVGSALVRADYDRLTEDERIWMTHRNTPSS